MSGARACRVGVAAACALALLGPSSALAAHIVVISGDAPGEGLADVTPVAPAGGNAATTVGGARLAALQFAADTWGAQLDSVVDIQVLATFDPLTCTPTSAVLGAAGAETVHRDFPSAPLPGVWYGQAEANALAGMDLDPTSADISAAFNSALDGGTCLGGQRWYYGFDGHPPPGTLDLVTITLHELAHGLGFITFVSLTTGEKLLGHDDAFMLELAQQGATPSAYPQMTDAQRVLASESDPQLQWTGAALDAAAPSILTAGINDGQVRMYGPATQAPGSSVSHFSTALAPNELMEPFYTGADHDVLLTAKLLLDTGWRKASAAVAVSGSTSRSRALLVLALALGGAVALTPRRRGRLPPLSGRASPRGRRCTGRRVRGGAGECRARRVAP